MTEVKFYCPKFPDQECLRNTEKTPWGTPVCDAYPLLLQKWQIVLKKEKGDEEKALVRLRKMIKPDAIEWDNCLRYIRYLVDTYGLEFYQDYRRARKTKWF